MSIASFKFPKRENFQFFSEETSAYFMPHIRCIAELQRMDSEFTDSGLCHVFKVFFSLGIDIDLAFETEKEAAEARRDLIRQIMDYWGSGQVVFSNGYDYDVTVISAIQEVTDVFQKSQHAGFALTVANVPYPLHLIFTDVKSAHDSHQSLCAKVEQYRKEAANSLKFKMVANG